MKIPTEIKIIIFLLIGGIGGAIAVDLFDFITTSSIHINKYNHGFTAGMIIAPMLYLDNRIKKLENTIKNNTKGIDSKN